MLCPDVLCCYLRCYLHYHLCYYLCYYLSCCAGCTALFENAAMASLQPALRNYVTLLNALPCAVQCYNLCCIARWSRLQRCAELCYIMFCAVLRYITLRCTNLH